jgi:hypothetical protein
MRLMRSDVAIGLQRTRASSLITKLNTNVYETVFPNLTSIPFCEFGLRPEQHELQNHQQSGSGGALDTPDINIADNFPHGGVSDRP